MGPIIIMLIEICLLNIIDCVQTVYAVDLYGLGIEANPIARYMLQNDSAVTIKLIAIPIILTIIGIVVYIDRRFRWVVYGVLIYYMALVLHNYSVLVQMGAI